MSKILLTGGNGLLGSYLKIEADRPSRSEFDITNYLHLKNRSEKEYDLIVHCAAYTDVQRAETDKISCFEVNVLGTLNLLVAFPNTPFIYISSEYAKNPINFYSLTKRMAEQLVEKHTASYLIIRTLFKAIPWPFEKAFIDQWTQGDQVNIIAPLIDKEIQNWDGRGQKLVYVGTGRKRIYDIAVKTKLDVIPNSIKDMKIKIPEDYV